MQCARSQSRTNLNSSKTESEHESVRSQAERVTKLPFRTQNSSPFVFLNTVFNSLHWIQKWAWRFWSRTLVSEDAAAANQSLFISRLLLTLSYPQSPEVSQRNWPNCLFQFIFVSLIPMTLLWWVCLGAESVVYEATLDGRKVAVKKPILSTSEELDNFHKELQLLWLFASAFAFPFFFKFLFFMCVYVFGLLFIMVCLFEFW